MADTERLFREALGEPEPASEPAMMDDGGDMRCPMCGASAKKIQDAAGGGEPPMDDGMMGMK